MWQVSVSLLMNTMTVEYDTPATPQAICAAVEAAGYGADAAGQQAAASPWFSRFILNP